MEGRITEYLKECKRKLKKSIKLMASLAVMGTLALHTNINHTAQAESVVATKINLTANKESILISKQ